MALELGLACGGWCPRGRKAEDGRLPARYPLQETPSDHYAQRTEWNVRDSDGTLVIASGDLSGGTAQTLECAARLQKPSFIVDLTQPPPLDAVWAWIAARGIRVLNVAGPRESREPGICARAAGWLREMLVAAPPSDARQRRD